MYIASTYWYILPPKYFSLFYFYFYLPDIKLNTVYGYFPYARSLPFLLIQIILSMPVNGHNFTLCAPYLVIFILVSETLNPETETSTEIQP